MQKLTYITYGFKSRDIEGVATQVGRVLGLRFTSKKDTILGRWYQAGKVIGENLDLLYNGGDTASDELLEPQYPQHLTVLYVNQTRRADELERALALQFQDGIAQIRQYSYISQLSTEKEPV